jgi:hypothetical protein
MKGQSHASNKVLIFPVAMFLGVVLFSVVIVNNLGLIVFNVMFGRPVYAVDMTYNFEPYYYSGQTLVKVSFNFQLTRPKQPIETILHQTVVQVVGQQTQLDVSSATFQFNIPVHIYTGQPQSQIKLYDGTFTYNDNKLREITIYLPNFDPTGKPNQEQVFVEIHGSYELNGQTYNYDAGAVLKIGM